MRPYPDRRHHTCPVPGTPPAADHHRARRIVPDRGVAAVKIINFSEATSEFFCLLPPAFWLLTSDSWSCYPANPDLRKWTTESVE